MKILWLDINSSFAHSSLAIPSLHAQLSAKIENKIKWKVLSATLSSNESIIINKILEFEPEVILSTQWLFNKLFSLNILSKISKLLNTKIILGGPEFLGDNEIFLRQNPFIESVFRGEGEEIFENFIGKLITEGDWKNITGFCYINKSGEYIDNGNCIVRNFRDLKIPESSNFFVWDKPFVQIETSRGCFNSCIFCISGIEKGVQNSDLELLEKRIESIVSKGIREIRILDRTFNANEKRAVKLLNIFSKFSGMVRFHLEVHPAFIGKEFRKVIELLPNNLLHIEAGIQSLNDEVIKYCKRAGKNSDVIDGIKFLVSLNKFEIHTDLIAGLPGYNLENIIDDVKTLCELEVDEIQVELLKFLPGTELRNRHKEFFLKFSSGPPYEVLESDSANYLDLLKCTVLSEIVDNWYNNKIWRKLFRILCLKHELFLKNYIEYIYTKSISLNSISKENRAKILYNYINHFYPDSKIEFPEYWINDGLSLKKGPGTALKEWKKGIIGVENPNFETDLKYEKYYYYLKENIVIWFIFNKSVYRDKPIKIIHQKIINH